MNKVEIKKFLLKNKSFWINKTPCFIIDKKKLKSNIAFIKNTLNGEIAYSHKTNPAQCVIRNIIDNNCSFLISSLEELEKVAKLNNFSAKKIIFQSPSLTLEQYEKIRKIGVNRYSIDSLDQLNMVLSDIKSNGAKLELLVRINTGVKIKNPELAYGMDSYLGFSLEDTEKILNKLNIYKNKGLIKIGIHNHLLSQNTYLDIWEKNLEKLTKFVQKMKLKKIEIDIVDFGGGYPVEYHGLVPDLKQISILISNAQKKMSKAFPKIHFIFEPGRKVIAESVSLIAKVVHIKEFSKNKIAILNCSLYNCSLDTLIVGLFLPAIKLQTEKNSSRVENYIIRGSTPDSLDIFARNIKLPELKNDDYVAFLNCGAYSFGSEFISLKKVECIEI